VANDAACPIFVRKTHEGIEQACCAGKIEDARDNGVSADFVGGCLSLARDAGKVLAAISPVS
jgi:hypothetical protein